MLVLLLLLSHVVAHMLLSSGLLLSLLCIAYVSVVVVAVTLRGEEKKDEGSGKAERKETGATSPSSLPLPRKAYIVRHINSLPLSSFSSSSNSWPNFNWFFWQIFLMQFVFEK